MAVVTQSVFDFNPPAGSAGELEDLQTAMYGEDESYTAGAAIPFGRAVFSAAATPNVCGLPSSEAEVGRLVGLSVKTQAKASGAGYAAAEEVRVSRRGRMRVYFETAVADKASLYVRITESATGAGDTGQFRGDSASGAAILCNSVRARSRNGVIGAAGIGVVEYDFRPGVGLAGPTGATGATGPTGPTGPTGT